MAGKENIQADYLSCNLLDPGEWALEDCVSSNRTPLGNINHDLMASMDNAKVAQFFSCTQERMSDGLDELSQRWLMGSLLYVFPPQPLIDQVLQKIEAQKGLVILLALGWPWRPWYMDMVHLMVKDMWWLPVLDNLLSKGPIFMLDMGQFLLTAWLLRGLD